MRKPPPEKELTAEDAESAEEGEVEEDREREPLVASALGEGAERVGLEVRIGLGEGFLGMRGV